MHIFQCVLKLHKKVNQSISSSAKKYVAALLISRGRKNCSSMSYELGIPYNSIYSFLDPEDFQEKTFKNYLISMVYIYATKENPGVLIVDSSQIIKLYSKKLLCIGYDFNGSMKLVLKGISCVTAAWTNGKIIIPLSFDFWIRKKDLSNNKKYIKKTALSIALIDEYKDKIPFGYVALDGDYGNEYCFDYLQKNNLKYSIRILKSRVVSINNIETQLKNHNVFKLKKNEKYKASRGTYKNKEMYFIVQKRKAPKGKTQVVFIASNIKGLTAKQHVQAFSLRWPIEKMFRTLKQSLGIKDCQSVSVQKQRVHIFATFIAFSELEKQKIFKKKKSPEQVLKKIRFKNRPKRNLYLAVLKGLIM